MLIVVFKHTLSKQYLNIHRIQLREPILKDIKDVALQSYLFNNSDLSYRIAKGYQILLFKDVLFQWYTFNTFNSDTDRIVKGYQILLLFKHSYRNNFLLRRWDFNTFNSSPACTDLEVTHSNAEESVLYFIRSKYNLFWTSLLIFFIPSSSESKA